MYRLQRVLVVGRDGYTRASRNLLQFPMQFSFKARHDSRAGHVLAVNQYGRVEVAVGEHTDNVLKVVANLPEAGRIFKVVDPSFNQPTVLRENKMMHRLFVREAHNFVALLSDHVVTVLGVLSLGLSIVLAVREATGQQNKRYDTQHRESPIVALL